MRFIEPSVRYIPQEAGMKGIWKQIAAAARVCYMSTARDNETDEDFVKRVILKPALIEGDLNDLSHCKFNNLKLHGGVLEHGTVYLDNVPNTLTYWYKSNPYSFEGFFDKQVFNRHNWIVTNIRVIIENNRWDDLQYLCDPTEYHKKRYTFNVITDIGTTREFNRHRASMSICEESTRYCNYSKDKFGGELTFIIPAKCNKQDLAALEPAYKYAEDCYLALLKFGWKPEQARQVLPLGLKTQACYTAFADEWKHFLALRSSQAASGAPHPNIRLIADKISEIAEEQRLWW